MNQPNENYTIKEDNTAAEIFKFGLLSSLLVYLLYCLIGTFKYNLIQKMIVLGAIIIPLTVTGLVDMIATIAGLEDINVSSSLASLIELKNILNVETGNNSQEAIICFFGSFFTLGLFPLIGYFLISYSKKIFFFLVNK